MIRRLLASCLAAAIFFGGTPLIPEANAAPSHSEFAKSALGGGKKKGKKKGHKKHHHKKKKQAAVN